MDRLSRYPHFLTNDVDEESAVLSKVIRSHRSEPVGKNQFELSSHTASLDTLAISWIVSTPRNIFSESDGRFYVLVIHCQGSGDCVTRGRRFFAGPNEGIFYVPDDTGAHTKIRGTTNRVIAVQIPVEALNREAERLIGTPVDSPFEITSVLKAHCSIGRMTEFFMSELEHDDGIFQRPNLASQEFQRAFITAMIESARNPGATHKCYRPGRLQRSAHRRDRNQASARHRQ